MDARQLATLIQRNVAVMDEIESVLKVTNPGAGVFQFTAYQFNGTPLVVSVVAQQPGGAADEA